MNIKIKLIFFSRNNLKIQPRTYTLKFVYVLINDSSDLLELVINCFIQYELLKAKVNVICSVF